MRAIPWPSLRASRRRRDLHTNVSSIPSFNSLTPASLIYLATGTFIHPFGEQRGRYDLNINASRIGCAHQRRPVRKLDAPGSCPDDGSAGLVDVGCVCAVDPDGG